MSVSERVSEPTLFFDQVDAAHLTKVKTKFEEVKKLTSPGILSISML